MGGGGLYDIDRNDSPEMFVTHKERSIKLFAEVMECLETQAEVPESLLKFLYEWKDIREEEKECYWYHPDHLGSSSWITFSDGKAVEHLHYMPWGEDFVRQRSSNWNAMYTFSAKEKDAETGFSYFGSRYYSSDLSIWLGVDPMSDKYPSLSPYGYCANNPVKLVDPNGEDIWKPEITESGDIRLLAEEGDNINTLSEFLGGDEGLFSNRKIKKMWDKRDSHNNVILSKNTFSDAIKRAKKEGLPEETNFPNCSKSDLLAMGYKKNYNCFGAAIPGANGDPIGYYATEDLDGNLKWGKWYSTDTPIFGKTLIRFADGEEASHAAIFFGKDHSGNTYVFTKNGYYFAPSIVNINENIKEYGPVTPLNTTIEDF